MNTINNQRFQSTEQKIQKALFSLLKIRKYNDISIKEICYEAGINRSSFYAHYTDINDLMIKTEQSLSREIAEIFAPEKDWNEQSFVALFVFLQKNKDFYKSYLETNDQPYMETNDFVGYMKMIKRYNRNADFADSEKIYHMAFFAGGIKAMAKSWIKNNCKETPEQMAQILTNEYKINAKHFYSQN